MAGIPKWGERITGTRSRPPLLLLSLGLLSDCLAANAVAGPLVGSWRLVSHTDTVAGETPIHAFGANPIGLFVFTADGHVSISIMRNPPDVSSPTTDPDPDACIPGWFCSETYQEGGKTVRAERVLARESRQ